jgi:uncharacterized glyoxalase superfamily protein PhnB
MQPLPLVLRQRREDRPPNFGRCLISLAKQGAALIGELDNQRTALAFADIKEASTLFPAGFHPHDLSAQPAAFPVSFVMPQVEDAYRVALEAGATGLMAPQAQLWGQTIARVRDPHGVLVPGATPIGVR